MLLNWLLIISVTSVSITMLMIIGSHLAILKQAQQYYGVNQTLVLLLPNSFNIFYILICAFSLNIFRKYFFNCLVISVVATGVAAFGRYLAGNNYQIALFMTIIIAISHIPIITFPFKLLSLFPDNHKGYAASIPLFFPIIGINFCIIYGITQITSIEAELSISIASKIDNLHLIIGIFGSISSIVTLLLIYLMKDKIMKEQERDEQPIATIWEGLFQQFYKYFKTHRLAMVILICWGSIVGINWTYGSLFGVIFQGQGLTSTDMAVLGLVANLSTAIFGNLGTFIKNKFKLNNLKIINALNLAGFVAAFLIQLSKYIPVLQNLSLLIFLIVVLRAGYSAFVSLAFIEMEKSGIPSIIISGMFFWIANMVNLATTEMVDLVSSDISLSLITLPVAFFIQTVAQGYIIDKKSKIMI